MLKSRTLTSDESGDVLGLPFEMLIISVVMLISIPLIFSYSSMYVRRQVESDLRVELEKLVDVIEEIEQAETGNRRTFSFNFNDHPLARVSYVEVGGEDHHSRSTIRYRFKDRNEMVMNLEGIEVSDISDGDFTRLELPLDGETIFIEKSPSQGFIKLSVGD
ncbi:MAG: hypothetical protein R6W73_00660 [Candidatus Saliniplasma sp.]